LAQQEPKPAVILSLAGVDRLLGDVGYLTRVAGSPEFGAVVTLMAGQYIEGLNTKQPAGAYVTFNDQQPITVAFVPVSDFAAVKRKLEESVGELQDIGAGAWKLTLQRELFLKEQGGWVFASDRVDRLANLPQDPAQMLAGLSQEYDLAVRVNVQQIPPQLRQMAIAEIKQGFEQSLENQTNDEQRELQKEFGSRAIEDLERYMEEADQVTVGWAIDQPNRKTYFDFALTAVPATKLAAQLAPHADATTNFAGFEATDAAATLHFSAPLAPEDIRQAKLMLDALRERAAEQIDKDEKLPDAAARAAAKEIVGAFLDLAQATIASGKVNGGATLWLAPEKINFVGGGFIADGSAAERNLKRLVELAKRTEDNPDVEVKFNTAQHRDVALHTLRIPVPEEEQQTRKILGDKLSLIVGTGPKSAYVAFGNEAMDLLKQVLDKSQEAPNSKTLPVKLRLRLAPVIQFAASVDDNPALAKLAAALQNEPAHDQVMVTASAIPQGVSYRLEIEAGVLSLIGQAAKLQNAGSRDPF